MDCQPITTHIERASFSLLTKQEIKRISVKKLIEPKSFEKLGAINDDGLYSRALGPVKRFDTCSTCGLSDMTCPGHYGHIELAVPVYHPMLAQTMYQVINKACFDCYMFRLSPTDLTLFLAQIEALENGFDHLVDQLNEMAVDICRTEKNIDYLNVFLGNRLKAMIEEEKEKVPNFECQDRPQQRSIVERLSKLFRGFINGQLIKPSKMCPHCNEKKTTTSFANQCTIYIGANVGKTGKDAKEKKKNKTASSRKAKTFNDFHIIKTDDKKILTPVGARYILRKLWENEKKTMMRIFHFLNLENKASHQDNKERSKSNDDFQPIDLFFIDTILVPPGKFRPPMSQQGYSFEGPRTAAMGNVMKQSYIIQEYIKKILEETDEISVEKMQPKLQAYWKDLQIAVYILYDNQMDKYGNNKYPGLKQLIDKKEGLFRKNMMGKRVNYAARSVISPDPNISVDQIGVPLVFAKVLTYPQPVTAWNLEQLREAVRNGPDKYPGAVSIIMDDGITISLTKESVRLNIANRLNYFPRNQRHRGDKMGSMVTIVNRHLLSGDVLLFNRQPTLHKPSIMAFRARVLPNEKGFRLHYANCKSFNADFDGDEMNAHLPQGELARSEAYNIASVNYQYLVPKDGSPLGGLIQDHVVAVCMLTRRDQFYDKERYHQLVFCSLNFLERTIKLEPPTIFKPEPLWTGKQVITTIIRNCIPLGKPPPTLKIKSKVGPKIMNIKPEFECLSDCHVYIKDGELLTGLMDKSNVGAQQYGLIHTCYELYGGETSSNLLSAFARLSTWFLQLYEGFTLGIADIIVESDAERDRARIINKSRELGDDSAKEALVLDQFLNSDELEDKLREAHSDRDPLPMKKLDAAMKKRTDDISSSISSRCLPEGLIRRFPDNNLQMMIQSGAKGGTVNALQISCLLGQIELEGRRVPLSMSGRSLPSFKPYDTSPKAGGFVSGRFLTGIQPQEFFFHCMAGREGLIDTAVKTSRSGYLQRCLIKHLEGLTVNYDQTVRDSCGSVIQFLYGEDGLDITRSQMLKEKAFSLLIDNYKIICPGEDESARLNKAKESYEEDIIAQTNEIQQWVEKNGENRVQRLRGSGFLDFQANILKDPEEYEKVLCKTAILQQLEEIDMRYDDDETETEDVVEVEVAQVHVKQELEQIADLDTGEFNQTETKVNEKPRFMTQEEDINIGIKIEPESVQFTDTKPAFVSSTTEWKKKKIRDAWYALSFKERRKWNKDWHYCPDPLIAVMNPGAHFGVVPERLDCIIECFVRQNPELVINSASLIGGGNIYEQDTFIECDTNPELSKTISAYWNQLAGVHMKPKLTKHEFYNLCYNLYMKMLAQPGEAVGLLAAQSIGEPSTQMTLNTFHFAGRGEMNVTLGIPRLREILMTASANIGTPSMDLPLLPLMYDDQGNELDEEETEAQAQEVKLALNAVRLSDVLEYVDITEQLVDVNPSQLPAAQGRKTIGKKRLKTETKSNNKAIQYTFLFSFLPSKYYKHEFVTSSKQIMKFMDGTFKTQLLDAINKRQKRLQLAETLFDLSSRKRTGDDDLIAKGNGDEDGGENPEDAADNRDEESPDDESDDDGTGEQALEQIIDSDKYNHISSSKHKYLLKLTVRQMTTRLDMGALIKAEARRTYIHRVGNIQRALIVKDVNAKARGAKCDKMIKTEGVSLLSLVRYSHILDLNAIYSNDIHAIARTYGIEAASHAIRREMANVFAVYGIEVDPRHLSLIADYMTYSGTVRGMNRMSMEANASPFQQMSFESTLRYLKQAAMLGLRDDIKSPSAALVFGRPTRGGTGLFSLASETKI